MSEHNHLNWTDFILCLGMELYFGDGSRDEKVGNIERDLAYEYQMNRVIEVK